MADTINGSPIIGTWVTPKRGCERAGRIIMVDRGVEYEERYVVAWQADAATTWLESCYCVTLTEALVQFTDRVARDVVRQ